MKLYAWKNDLYDILVYTKTNEPQVDVTKICKSTGEEYQDEEYTFTMDNKTWRMNNTISGMDTDIDIIIELMAYWDDGITFQNNNMRLTRDIANDISDNFISKFKHNNVTYTIKDAKAREDILTKQDKIDANNKLSANLIDGLSTVATSGSYNDLSNKPTIPTVNDATITITQGGTTKGTFTVNQSSNTTIVLDAGGGDSLPDQTGQAGKFLTTDGTNASWAEVQGGSSSTITYFDSTNWTLDSTNIILSTGLSLGNNVNVFKNGQLIEPGASNDYTISGNNIVFTEPLTSTDKIAVINGNMNPMQSVGYNTFSNKSILATDWVTDNTYSGYNYKCDIPCTGVTSTMYAQVTFAPEEAMSGNYANICDTGTGVVTIYSKVAQALTIPMIMVLGV